jgi:hypothetical protein
MRTRLIVALVPALLLAACGDDGGVFSTLPTGAGESTTTIGAVTTSSEGPAASTTTEAPTTTEAATTTTTTTTTLPAEPVWMRVADDGSLGGPDDQGMVDVAVGDPGLVAVGYDYSGGDGDAAVWASGDGSAWARLAHDEVVFGGGGDQEMNAVVAGGPGFVAVGWETLEESDAAVWTSPDGLAWTRLPHDEAVFGGYCHQFMKDVVVAGPGLVAVGGDCSHGDRDAAVWVSANGLAWSRVAHDAAVFGGGDEQGMESVALGPAGLVAVGYDYSGGDWDAAVWVSADGLTWSRVAHDEAVFGGADNQEMWSVAASPAGVVAVGYDDSGGDRDAAVWVSADGLTWSRVAHDATVFGGADGQEMASVVITAAGPVAVGDDEAGGNWDAAVWVSADGLAWSRVPHNRRVFGGAGNQSMWAATVAGSTVVAVGETGGGDDWDAAVWLRRSAG